MVLIAAILSHILLLALLFTPLWSPSAKSEGHDLRRWGTTLAVTLAYVLLMQALVARPRPQGGEVELFGLSFYGFPSGHAALAAAAATQAILRGWSREGRLVFVVAAVAGLRIASGAHFMTDVLVGATLGVSFGVAGARMGRDSRPAWSWAMFPWLATLIAMLVWASLGLGAIDNLTFTGADKPMHFLVFGIMGFFAVGWFHRRPPSHVLLTLSGVAVLEELTQAVSPNRTLDGWDAAMSVAGILCFGGVGALLKAPPKGARSGPRTPSRSFFEPSGLRRE